MTRYAGGFLPLPGLDRHCGETLHAQIVAHVARAIRSGAVAAGERLPSTRAMARASGVSRNTVIEAYDELTALGLIDPRRGDGVHVTSNPISSHINNPREVRTRAVALHDADGNLLYVNF